MRYPDLPKTGGNAKILEHFDNIGGYMAQMKFDGWRDQMTMVNGDITHQSRHNKPLAVEIKPKGINVGPDSQWIFDCEWCKMRASARKERLWFFDCIMAEDAWILNLSAVARFEILRKVVPTELIVPFAFTDYRALFELSKHEPWISHGAEGIVLKRQSSIYLGSIRESKKNPEWIKVKWREGADGQVVKDDDGRVVSVNGVPIT